MSNIVVRAAEGLLARFVPALAVHAARCSVIKKVCPCQGPFRAERECYSCSDGSVRCGPCVATIQYCGPR